MKRLDHTNAKGLFIVEGSPVSTQQSARTCLDKPTSSFFHFVILIAMSVLIVTVQLSYIDRYALTGGPHGFATDRKVYLEMRL